MTDIILYTLPTCGICNMIKTKLNQKKIPYIEKDFSLIADTIQSDRAPALKINNNIIINSVTEMVAWINNYQG